MNHRKKNNRCQKKNGNAHARNKKHETGACPSGNATDCGAIVGYR